MNRKHRFNNAEPFSIRVPKTGSMRSYIKQGVYRMSEGFTNQMYSLSESESIPPRHEGPVFLYDHYVIVRSHFMGDALEKKIRYSQMEFEQLIY